MTAPREIRTPAGIAIAVVILAVVYVAGARIGLTLHAVSGFATLVWAPSGVSLAALVLFGQRLWPGVAIGALVANLLTGAPFAVATGIAVGNTLEAVLATLALRRVGFRPSLERVRDVLVLLTAAALVSTALSATIGVTSLSLGGMVAEGAGPATWLAWWVGDMIGDVLVAPLLLVWLSGAARAPARSRTPEVVALAATVLAVAGAVFGLASSSELPVLAQAYFLFPVLIWAALRFGQGGAVATAFVVSVVAVWGTALDRGPFAQSELHDNLFALQMFLGVTAATFLILGATIAERREAVRQLVDAVRDAREARDQAAAANRAKSDFLAVMSHELRTPLNAILGYSELLDVGVDGELNERQRGNVDRIRRNQRQLQSLVDDLLSFARTEAGRLTFDLRPVSVADTVDAVEASLGREARRRSIRLSRDIKDDARTVRADEARLRQVLLNLVGNAVKFTPDGGSIAINASRHGDRVRIDVVDSGIGIPADQLSKVFEPFFQVEGGKTREHGGVGLGLPISRDLVQAMDGKIWLESQVASGTTVSVELPAEEQIRLPR